MHFFMSQLPRRLCNHLFSEPTFRPSGSTRHWKNTVFGDFPTSSRTSIFSLLTFSLSDLLSSDFLSLSVHSVENLTSKQPSVIFPTKTAEQYPISLCCTTIIAAIAPHLPSNLSCLWRDLWETLYGSKIDLKRPQTRPQTTTLAPVLTVSSAVCAVCMSVLVATCSGILASPTHYVHTLWKTVGSLFGPVRSVFDVWT